MTGAFSLLVLLFTLRYARNEAERAESERSRVRRADRLRDSYRDYVSAAYAIQARAAMLPIALVESECGRPSLFNDVTDEPQADMSAHNVRLMLEEDADRAVLKEFSALNAEHLSFLARVASGIRKGEEMLQDEYEQRILSMQARVDNIASLARGRLAELEARR